MTLLSAPRTLPLRHCITVPAAVASGLALALGAAPAHAADTHHHVAQPGLKHPGRVLPASPAVPPTVVVEPGDSVSAIASRYGLDTAELLARNGLDWSSIIHPGDVLVLVAEAAAPAAPEAAPAPEASAGVAYDIVAGDTMWAIAQAHGVDLDGLLAANGLTRDSIVYPGERITVPTGAVAMQNVAAVTPAPVEDAPAEAAPPPVVESAPVAEAAPVEAPAIVELDAEQAGNAAIIVSVGRSLGIPDRGIAIALATAMVESSLRNVDGGPDDSGGLFQQRPSQGWGTEAEVRDPWRAAAAFYGGPSDPNGGRTPGLLDISGWEGLGFGEAAQAVQVSAYPDRYDLWAESATVWLSVIG